MGQEGHGSKEYQGVNSTLDGEVRRLMKVVNELFAQTWCDPLFKVQFLQNPIKFIAESYEIPENIDIFVSECYERWVLTPADETGKLWLQIPYRSIPEAFDCETLDEHTVSLMLQNDPCASCCNHETTPTVTETYNIREECLEVREPSS